MQALFLDDTGVCTGLSGQHRALCRGVGCRLGQGLFLCIATFDNNPCGVANRSGTGRDGFNHNSIGAYFCPLANGKAPQDLRPGANDHTVLEGGVAFGPLIQAGPTQGHSLIDGAIIANGGGFPDDYAQPMIDKHPFAGEALYP